MPPSFEASMRLNDPPPLKKFTPLVPVIDISPSRKLYKSAVNRRTYNEEPLPVKPSEKAPRNARITGRVAEPGEIPVYTLEIGEVQIDDVTLEEVLDYVSALELEQFENRQFEEERDVLRIALADAEAAKERKREKQAERARNRGGVPLPRESSNDDESEVETGRHGRARPKYTHLFPATDGQRKKRRKRDPDTGELLERSEDESTAAPPSASADAPRRRRRKRDPITNELLPLSDRDEDDDIILASSSTAAPGLSTRALPAAFEVRKPTASPALELPKRRRRKRDPKTGELLPLEPVTVGNGIHIGSASEVADENDMEVDSSAASAARASDRAPSSVHESNQRTPGSEMELPKRRRRQRDPATGELLPLQPSSKATSTAAPTVDYSSDVDHRKKPRRRRHPITGEMMPLGFRFDPDTGKMYQKSRDTMSPAMRQMSISQEHYAKRVKITSESSEDDSPQSRPPSSGSNRRSLQGSSNRIATPQRAPPAVSETDDLAEDDDQHPPMSAVKSQPTPKTSIMRPTAAVPSSESSPEPITLQSFLKSSGRHDMDSDDEDMESSEAEVKKVASPPQAKTSIMNPVATQPDPESEDDLEEDEWFVEAIIGHRMSDPRSHIGIKPTMLYHTKWEGSDELTWEPADSFDPSTVEDYRKRVGLDKKLPQSPHETIVPVRQAAPMQKSASASASKPQPSVKPASGSESSGAESEDGDEDDYVVEKILAHHMSDPRTHPGKPQTMLYRVKWVGWDELTWEPIDSFPEKALVNDYRRKVGLPKL